MSYHESASLMGFDGLFLPLVLKVWADSHGNESKKIMVIS